MHIIKIHVPLSSRVLSSGHDIPCVPLSGDLTGVIQGQQWLRELVQDGHYHLCYYYEWWTVLYIWPRIFVSFPQYLKNCSRLYRIISELGVQYQISTFLKTSSKYIYPLSAVCVIALLCFPYREPVKFNFIQLLVFFTIFGRLQSRPPNSIHLLCKWVNSLTAVWL